MDKQVNGLSEIQKDVLTGMYLEKDNKQICEEMGISAATVRSHKFNLQKSKREAKILLALLEQIENETIVKQRKKDRAGSFINRRTIGKKGFQRQHTASFLYAV